MNQVKTGEHSEKERRKQVKKVAVASVVGTSIEWYDFFLYGTMSALVFPKLFFPQADPFINILQSFTVFFLGFLARPIGAMIFGHFGDRIGRKATLVTTLMFMGISTVLIGLLPTYESIGMAAPILLILLRMCQGIGVGGEWGGSVVLSTEWSSKKRRGLMGSMTQLGVPIGLLTSTLIITLCIQLTGSGFDSWGWRIPFILSAVLIGVGLYIRLGIMDSPQFTRLKQENRIVDRPVLEALKKHPKEIVLTACARLVEQVPFYIFTTFVITYGTEELKLDKQIFTNGVMVAACIELFVIPYFAHLSDRVNRKKIYILGSLLTIVFAFPFFMMIDTGNPVFIILAIALSIIGPAMAYGPQAALIVESFPIHLRYTGSSLGFHFASVIGGGIAPLFSAYLFHKYGSTNQISVYIIVVCIISIISVFMLKKNTAENAEERMESVQQNLSNYS